MNNKPPDNTMNWEQQFDEKFHQRIWNIVKKINPASYSIAKENDLLKGKGPRIYGEIIDFISQTVSNAVEARDREIVEMIESLKVKDIKEFDPSNSEEWGYEYRGILQERKDTTNDTLNKVIAKLEEREHEG